MHTEAHNVLKQRATQARDSGFLGSGDLCVVRRVLDTTDGDLCVNRTASFFKLQRPTTAS